MKCITIFENTHPRNDDEHTWDIHAGMSQNHLLTTFDFEDRDAAVEWAKRNADKTVMLREATVGGYDQKWTLSGLTWDEE